MFLGNIAYSISGFTSLHQPYITNAAGRYQDAFRLNVSSLTAENQNLSVDELLSTDRPDVGGRAKLLRTWFPFPESEDQNILTIKYEKCIYIEIETIK